MRFRRDGRTTISVEHSKPTPAWPPPETTTLWDFPRQGVDGMRIGDPAYPGVTPALACVNAIQRFTAKGDLVVDPMAGCYDESTDVLTRDGWKAWPDVSAGDEFATLVDGKLEYCRAHGTTKVWHDGLMYRLRTKHVDLLVTPDHWLYVAPRYGKRGQYDSYRLVRARDVFGKNVRHRKDATWVGEERASFELPELRIRKHKSLPHGGSTNLVFPRTLIPMDKWLRFLGHWLTDGSCTADRGSYNIMLTQLKPRSRREFRTSLVQIAEHLRRPLHHDAPNVTEVSAGFTIRHKQMGAYLVGLGKKGQRRLPREVLELSPRQLRILYEALLDGDGHRWRPAERRGTDRFYTSSPFLRDAFQELCLKLGWAATIRESSRSGDRSGQIDGRTIEHKVTTWDISVNKRQLRPRTYTARNRYDRIDTRALESWDYYRGYVYCANVPPSHVLYIRRNGSAVWCGNSGTTIDAARLLGRRALGFDLVPRRPDILPADARALPLPAACAHLEVVDPQYSDNLRYSDDPRCLGLLPAPDPAYYEAVEAVAREVHRVLRPGGVLVWITSDEYRRRRFTPVGFRTYERILRSFEPSDIVCLARRNDRSATPMWEHRARARGFYLRGFKYLFLMRKGIPS